MHGHVLEYMRNSKDRTKTSNQRNIWTHKSCARLHWENQDTEQK